MMMSLRHDLSTISALVRREMVVRFGRENIGFAWVFVEPMILTLGVMTIWSLIKPPFEHGVQLVALVIAGYLPLTLFRHLTNSNVNIMRASVGLLYHRSISIWHVILSRSVTEFTGTTIALIIIYGTLYAFGQIAPVQDVRLVISAWLLIAYYGFSIALLIAALTQMSEVAERFVQTYQYLQLPISGAFFMVEWLPTEAQDLVTYNPFVHGFEMFRAGLFGENVPSHYSPVYMLTITTSQLLLGIMAVNSARKTLEIG